MKMIQGCTGAGPALTQNWHLVVLHLLPLANGTMNGLPSAPARQGSPVTPGAALESAASGDTG